MHPEKPSHDKPPRSYSYERFEASTHPPILWYRLLCHFVPKPVLSVQFPTPTLFPFFSEKTKIPQYRSYLLCRNHGGQLAFEFKEGAGGAFHCGVGWTRPSRTGKHGCWIRHEGQGQPVHLHGPRLHPSTVLFFL